MLFIVWVAKHAQQGTGKKIWAIFTLLICDTETAINHLTNLFSMQNQEQKEWNSETVH